MQIRKIAFLFLLSSTVLASELHEVEKQVSAPDVEVVESLINSYSIVGYSWVSQPLGKILLIKTPREICAIRYLSFSRGNDKNESSVFKSGDESFDAIAEKWSSKGRHAKKIFLKKRPFYGIGKLGFSPSENRIQCGDDEYIWEYPTSTIILSKDHTTLLSPTKLESFELINITDKSLIWYGYEEERKIQLVPLE